MKKLFLFFGLLAPVFSSSIAVTFVASASANPGIAPPPASPLNAPDFFQSDAERHRRHMEFRRREAEAEYAIRAYPLQRIPPGAMARAQAQIQQAGVPGGLSAYQWYNTGPAPMANFLSTSDLSLQVSGRVSALAVDPEDGDHWLLGAAQGGIWETTDAGNVWAPRTDDQASLAMGAITFAPNDPLLVYGGTGEPNFSGDSYAGAGLLVSTNGGTAWQMLNSSFAGTSFSRIEVDTDNSNNVSATTVTGIGGVGDGATNPPDAPLPGLFISSSGGTNFTRVLTGDATDLLANSYNFQQQYAALGNIFGDPTNGVYRTTNGWASWQLINGPWAAMNPPTNTGRIALVMAPETTGVVYVGVSYTADEGGLVGIWQTSNAFDISTNIV
jgi:hypothetical protein